MYCSVCKKDTGSGTFCPQCGNRLDADSAAHHLKPGTVLSGKYVILNFIGEGGFGITYIGRDANLDLSIAIKEYYPCGFAGRNNGDSNSVLVTAADKRDFFENGKKRFLQEARSLAKFSKERGIVNVRDYFEENDTAYIVMEYLEGQNLNTYVGRNGRMDITDLLGRMKPLMESLQKIHEAGIIHRDISPDNIMFQKNGTLKLMDFGSARYFTNNESEMSVILKQGFSPEEQYRKKGNQGPWTDVYSLCATIYSCITGVVPESALDRLHSDSLQPPSRLGVRISPAQEAALMSGLAVHPENRCKSMAELLRRFGSVGVSPNGAWEQPDPRKAHEVKNMNPGAAPNGQVNPPQTTGKKRVSPVAVIVAAVCAGVLLITAALAVTIPSLLKNGTKTESQESKKTAKKSSEEKSKKTVSSDKADTAKKTVVMSEEGDGGSEDQETISVPDVVGLRSNEATQKLAGAGFQVSVIQAESSSVEADYVISQSPVGDKKAKREDVVTVYVSTSHQADAPPKSNAQAASAPTAAPQPAATEPPKPDYTVYYCCASVSATLRSIPSRSGADLAQIGSREEVHCVGEDGEFYNVIYNGQSGYVLKDFFSQDPNAPLNYGSGNAPSSSEPDPTVYYCCASESATLRSIASRDGADLAQVPSRAAVQYISSSGEFYYVSYGGQTGYVLKSYFSTDPNAPLNYGNN